MKRSKFSDSQIIDEISGYSTRVGGAKDHLTQGASLPQIMVKGGWVKPDTVSGILSGYKDIFR